MPPRFYGTEPLTGFMDGFFDAVVIPPQSGQFVEAVIQRLTQSGRVTLTYEYTVVPSPAGLAMLGLGGCSRRGGDGKPRRWASRGLPQRLRPPQ